MKTPATVLMAFTSLTVLYVVRPGWSLKALVLILIWSFTFSVLGRLLYGRGPHPDEASVRSSLIVSIPLGVIILSLLYFDKIWHQLEAGFDFVVRVTKFREKHQLVELFCICVPMTYCFVRNFDRLVEKELKTVDLKYFPVPAALILGVTNIFWGLSGQKVLPAISAYFPLVMAIVSLLWNGIAYFVATLKSATDAGSEDSKQPLIVVSSSQGCRPPKSRRKAWFLFYSLSWMFLFWALLDFAVVVAIAAAH